MTILASYLEGKDITKREWQIINCWAEGMSYKESGVYLRIEANTVKSHARRIFKKLGAVNQAQAVAIAFRNGLIE